MDELETLQKLGRERRLSVRRGYRDDLYEIICRTGATVHLGTFEATEKFIKASAVHTPDRDTRHRVLTAACSKRGYHFTQLDGDDAYALKVAGPGGGAVVIERADFRELISFLDTRPVQQ